MNGIYRKLRGFALAALAATAFISQAQASLVSISPASQNIAVGGNASIDILISGLTDPVGGFSLTLTFNDSFVSGASYTNDPDGKMGALPLDLSGGFLLGNTLDLFFVADAAETEASLLASEGAGFRLATVSFLGLADGISPLTLSSVVLSNWDGSSTLAAPNLQNGQICVGANCGTNPVPEPTSMLLVAVGLGVLGVMRRKHVL